MLAKHRLRALSFRDLSFRSLRPSTQIPDAFTTPETFGSSHIVDAIPSDRQHTRRTERNRFKCGQCETDANPSVDASQSVSTCRRAESQQRTLPFLLSSLSTKSTIVGRHLEFVAPAIRIAAVLPDKLL